MNKSFPIIFVLALVAAVSCADQIQSFAWTGPTTWGVTEAQTNFKSITNLNAPNWIVGNQTINDYNKQLYRFITNNNVTKCPIQTPFLQGSDSECINCAQPTPIFDLYKKECVACPAGTKLNPDTHNCQKAQISQPTNKCTSNYIWNETQNKCVCPKAFPIDLGCECVKCLEPFIWNAAQRACKLRCEQSHNWNNSTQKCECPKTAPYEVNGECIACNTPFEWQATINSCQLKVNSCPTLTVQTTQNCSSNFIWDSSVQRCVCPPNLPFNDGTRCVECNLPQYWDHDLKQCLSCPQYQYFNTLSRACEACPTAKPLYRNNVCEPCPFGTIYEKLSNSCRSQEAFLDPMATAKIPVYTTVPVDSGFIDPSVSATIPVYQISPVS